MNAGLRAVTQVSLTLLLALSLGLVTALPSAAEEPEPKPASISPDKAEYDLHHPADLHTIITWNDANAVDSIHDEGDRLREDVDYSVTDDDGVTAKLIILDDYLARELAEFGQSVVLRISFDVGPAAELTITTACQPSTINPESETYDLDDPPLSVSTYVKWGDATKVSSVWENDPSEPLEESSHYAVVRAPAWTRLEIFVDDYLKERLARIDQYVVLTIEFDCGPAAEFTITAIGTRPEVHPDDKIADTGRARYDLDHRAAVNSTITWGAAKNVDRIVGRIADGDEHELEEDTHYTVSATDTDHVATLTINGSYLKEKLTDIGHEVDLIIEFDVADVQLTVRATGTPTKLEPVAAQYDIVALRTVPLSDAAGSGVTINVNWGTATWVTRIVDDHDQPLEAPRDYSWGHPSALIIHEEYLTDRLTDLEQRVTLTISFNVGPPAEFRIEASGQQPEINPQRRFYDRQHIGDVTTQIAWGSASRIVQIRDRHGYILQETIDYELTDTEEEGYDRELRIFHDPYLGPRLQDFRARVDLEIVFDIGRPGNLEITSGCFIATAAYDTPTAEEVQVLREFRDRYLLTNPPGRLLIDAYYRVSPPLAGFITGHPTLQPVVRAGLMPAVVVSAVVLNTTPAEKMAIVGLLLLVSAALAVWTTGRLRGARTIPERQSRTLIC